MSRTNRPFGPWSMSATHECRLSAFWKRRFAALGIERSQPSRRQLVCGVLLLGLLLAMPALQLGPRQAVAEEKPIRRFPVSIAATTDPTSASPQPLPPAARTAPASGPTGVAPRVPAVSRRWQLIDDPQLSTPSAHLALMVGEQRRMNLPKGGLASSSVPDVFSAEQNPLTGNVTIRAKTSGVGIFKTEFEDRDKLEMQVVVVVDPAPLKAKLKQVGFDAIRVTPTIQGVILSGQVDTAKELNSCIAMADELFPLVVNNILLRGQEQVLLHCKIFEFVTDETKATEALRWLFDDQMKASSNGIRTALLDGSAFDTTIDTLRKSIDVRVLAEPVLTTLSGRPAAFNAGGEFPIVVPQGAGHPNAKSNVKLGRDRVAVEYRQFGTAVQFVPVVIGNGRLRLEVRTEISQIETNKNSVVVDGVAIPSLRTRSVDTSAEMNVEQTMVVAMVHEDAKGKHKCFVTMVRPSMWAPIAKAAEGVVPIRRR